jgi:hypothetical protein
MASTIVDLFAHVSFDHLMTHLQGVPFRRLADMAYSLSLA